MKFDKKSFSYRFGRTAFLHWILIGVSLTIAIKSWLLLFLVLLLFGIITYLSAKWNMFYILSYDFTEDSIRIKYLRFNKQITRRIHLDKLSAKLIPLPTKSKNWEIEIIENGKVILTQTTIGGWGQENIRNLFRVILKEQKKEPSLGEKINLNW